jgi:hypothetical protein
VPDSKTKLPLRKKTLINFKLIKAKIVSVTVLVKRNDKLLKNIGVKADY